MASESFAKIQAKINFASGKLEIDGGLLSKFANLSDRFYSVTEDAALTALQQEDREAWITIQIIFYRIGKLSVISEVFYSQIVKNNLVRIISKSQLEELKRKSPEEHVKVMFDSVLEFVIGTRAKWFNDSIESNPKITIFVGAVLAPCFARLATELGSIFSPALPDIFHKVTLNE